MRDRHTYAAQKRQLLIEFLCEPGRPKHYVRLSHDALLSQFPSWGLLNQVNTHPAGCFRVWVHPWQSQCGSCIEVRRIGNWLLKNTDKTVYPQHRNIFFNKTASHRSCSCGNRSTRVTSSQSLDHSQQHQALNATSSCTYTSAGLRGASTTFLLFQRSFGKQCHDSIASHNKM